MTRPLYGRFAWAYDSIVPHGAGGTVDQIAVRLRSLGLGPGSLLVDVGCGTGEHSVGLADRGLRVIGLDRSAALLQQARRKTDGVEFVHGDLHDWRPTEPVDAVLCRGVLNDLTTDRGRQDAFAAFASWLAPGGALLADVRDWEATIARYAGGLRHERAVDEPSRVLRFSSETSLDPDERRMVVHERYRGCVDGVDVNESSAFVMRCWTAHEVVGCGRRAGFASVEVTRGARAGIAADRLLVVARK